MYAIIETGGKQFKVTENCVITVEKLNVEKGSRIVFENVLTVVNGEETTFGAPYVSGAKVSATVLSQGRGRKVIVYKFKSKKGYHKKKGHRQPFTKLKVNKIEA